MDGADGEEPQNAEQEAKESKLTEQLTREQPEIRGPIQDVCQQVGDMHGTFNAEWIR